jgi:hypothetical protein
MTRMPVPINVALGALLLRVEARGTLRAHLDLHRLIVRGTRDEGQAEVALVAHRVPRSSARLPLPDLLQVPRRAVGVVAAITSGHPDGVRGGTVVRARGQADPRSLACFFSRSR